jgi:hypothetical protein
MVLFHSLVTVLLTPRTARVHEGPPSDPGFGTRGMPPLRENYLTNFPKTWCYRRPSQRVRDNLAMFNMISERLVPLFLISEAQCGRNIPASV